MADNVDLHVAGYHLTELIGSGGMGEVYKAVVAKEGKSLPVGTVVAVKLLHTHLQRIREFQKRFHREASLAAKIDHPNVVRVIEAGIDYRYHYIVMEYVEGLKLTDLMQDKQPLSPQQTIEVMSQICEALHAASHIIDDYSLDVDTDADDLPAVSNIPVRIRSLVHRDIKPDNILIQPRDPREYEQMSQTGDKKALANIHVKLLDFGLAKDVKAISTILSMAGQSLGTPAYMSPEQCQGDIVDQRTDIYSLGICAYQMITGTTPFPGPTTVAYAKQHAEEIPPDILTRNPLCPKNLADCIMRCLAKDAKDRYQTPETLKEDLQRVAQGKSVCKIHKFKKPRSISKRKISAIVLTTVVVVLLAMGGLWYYVTDQAKSSLQEAIRRADLAVAAEKYAEAEDILNQAISDFPDRPDKEQLTAMAQLRLRDISAQAARQRNALAKARAEEEERRRKAAEEQVKRQHEQAAQKAITEIQAHIAQGEFPKAIDAANQAVKQYADTDSGKKIPELLAEATTKLKGRQEAERAKEEAEKKRREAEKIARHDRFVEYRDQGRAAMQKRDYHAARIAFENVLKEEDDEDTRKQYDLAVDRTTRHRIAVVDFSEKGDVGIQDAGRVVAELLVSKFSLDRYELIERSQLARLLEEVDLSISLVRDNPEKAYENLKKLKSVRFLIIGSVVKLGDLTATARMVDVQTGVIRQTAEVSATDAQTLKDALKELANILQMTPEEKRDYLDERARSKLINDVSTNDSENKQFEENFSYFPYMEPNNSNATPLKGNNTKAENNLSKLRMADKDSLPSMLCNLLNMQDFAKKGEAINIVSARLSPKIVKESLEKVKAETQEMEAIQLFIEMFDYLPSSQEELISTDLIFFARKNMITDVQRISLDWSKSYGYSFNISDFHILSRLARDPLRYNFKRTQIVTEIDQSLKARKHIHHSPQNPDVEYIDQLGLQIDKLNMADLWNLYLINEMLSRPKVQTKLRLMADGDMADTKSAWGGLVFYLNGQAEAHLYPPDTQIPKNDLVYQPSGRVILDGRDSLCRLIGHFEKIDNASRAGPTADELADAKVYNYYGLILTRVDSDHFCAHYYNPAGRVISLGVFPLR